MEKYCISIDWLQVCGHYQVAEFWDNLPSEVGPYKVIIEDRGTRTFRHLATIKRVVNSTLVDVASVQYHPHSSALNQRLVILKLANRVLYSQNMFKVLNELLTLFGITYKGLTRLDVCCDFNFLSGHRSPERFLRSYVSTPYGSPRYVLRSHTNKFQVVYSRPGGSQNRVEYVRWGSDSSAKCCYMYDKTIELDSAKDKPWIRDTWAANGLISDEDTHVWRAEISIKCDGMDVLHLGTGELFKLNPDYLESQTMIEHIFFTYSKYMFDFRRRGQATRERDFTPIRLWDTSTQVTARPITITNRKDTGRTELICARALERLSYTYSDFGISYTESLCRSVEFLSLVSGHKRSIDAVNKRMSYLNYMAGQQFLSDDMNNVRSLAEKVHEVELSLSSLYANRQDMLSYLDYIAYQNSLTQQPLMVNYTPSEARRYASTESIILDV